MISEFQSINWQTVFSLEQDSSSMFSSFYNVMSTIIDKLLLSNSPRGNANSSQNHGLLLH